MKKTLFLILFASCFALLAQNKMYIHKSDKISLGASLASIGWKTANDSLFISSGGISTSVPLATVDSVSFADYGDTVRIVYNGSSAYVINPLAFESVAVTTTGAKVVITSTSTIKGLNYKISGTSSDGSLKIYSDAKFNLVMENVNLTNTIGPAINVQSGKTTSVYLPAGTASYIKDGTTYADSVLNSSGVYEDQNAAFFCKGNVAFSGTGSLTISGVGTEKHGLVTKDEMTFADATLIVKSATKDGLHPKDGFTMSSGTLNINSTGDAIDADEGYLTISGGSVTTNNAVADANGISSFSTMYIANAVINVTVTGDADKGINAGGNLTLGAGTYTLTTSGKAVLAASGSGYDPSYCSAIKCDSSIIINGSNIIIKSTGLAGKGISADQNIQINSGTVNITTTGAGASYKNTSGTTDCYHATCITADGNVTILGGTVTTSSSGSAGRGITADGLITIGSASTTPTISMTTSGAKVTLSGSDYCEAKAMKGGRSITITSGNITVSSADDGIKADTSIVINGGTITISKSVEGIEAPKITINAGTIDITASDDGINTSWGNGGESNDGSLMTIAGGTVYINTTGGDGLDSNGSIAITGGTIIVNGPPSSPEVGLDYNGTCDISGGLLLVAGPNSGNMIQATSTTSTQYAVKVTMSSTLSTSTIFNIQDASGTSLVTYKPLRSAYYIVFSSSSLKSGSTYNIYTGGTCTGTLTNGYYAGGTYSGGTLKKSFSVSSKVTAVSF
jgi:trimeric autotransporter adhesin